MWCTLRLKLSRGRRIQLVVVGRQKKEIAETDEKETVRE